MSEKETKPTPDYLGFLREYRGLCRKFGVCISSCGCCKSPWPEACSDVELALHIQHLTQGTQEVPT